MKTFCALLCIGVSVAAWGEDMTTQAGRTYTNIVVQRYDSRGIFIHHDGGDDKVLYKDILPELRGYYRKMAQDLMPAMNKPGEKEDPPGDNDLATLSGKIYRDVAVKKVDEFSISIEHDGGTAKVYFSEIPKAQQEKYRTGTPVVPDNPPGSNDLVAADGQIFRNIEILRAEPDGLTFHHAGGLTKLRFPALSKELQKKYEYDPDAAAKYQRAAAAEKRRVQKEEAARLAQKQAEEKAAAVPVSVFDIKTDELPNSVYRISFAVKNLSGQLHSIRAIPYDRAMSAIMGGKRFDVPAHSDGERLEIVVPIIQPKQLRVFCDDYQTNCTLRW